MKLTIGISFHNAHDYAIRCLDSIINQSFKDFILYCQCDRCEDDTHQIIDEYLKDKNIAYEIWDSDFGRVGKARNNLIQKCNTELFYSMDDDDTLLDKYMLRKFAKEFKNNITIVRMKDYIMSNDERGSLDTLWRNMYKTELVKKHRIPNIQPAEDLYYMQILKCDSLYKEKILEGDFYLYNIDHKGSVMYDFWQKERKQ